ncbi:MAG: biopolymer transporter ExbD, partial [Prevotella sp.]|nr:biopolymer transporter ExbD [Prevotella sp.]
KIKKSDVWIDMTPMSDVMVLLLTFFMMTSTFVKNEPVKVNTPMAASKVKVPENDVLNITINPQGKVFMSMDNINYLKSTLGEMLDQFGVKLDGAQQAAFLEEAQFGVPMDKLGEYLNLPSSKKADALAALGIPTDSIEAADGTKGKSEFQHWVDAATNANHDMKLCIKADSKTPYKVIKQVMSELQDMDQNRYQLITSFKEAEE